jgi:predicted XRE-type DNA-binding protein
MYKKKRRKKAKRQKQRQGQESKRIVKVPEPAKENAKRRVRQEGLTVLGRAIKKFALDNGLLIRETAEMLGVPRTHLSKLMYGRIKASQHTRNIVEVLEAYSAYKRASNEMEAEEIKAKYELYRSLRLAGEDKKELSDGQN